MDQQIDENLRRVYQDVRSEPVPPRFAELLEKLRQQDKPDRSKLAEGDE